MDQSAIPHWYRPDDDVLTLARGEGTRVYDEDGEEYLDFLSQLYSVNAGHSCERIVSAMTEQARRAPYVAPSKHTPVRTELAEKLIERAPDGLTNVFFAVSGSEANELAVQLAREYRDASTVLTRWRSYHGATYGAAALTGDPETRAPVERHAATTGYAKFLPPLDVGGPFDADTPEALATRAADHLEWVLRNEGPDHVAALLTEPVGGTSGAYPAPPGYFERVRELCDEHDVLLVADEVITGFGRCGDWFASPGEGLEPDLLTFAKGVTSSYAPLAGVLVSDEVADMVADEGLPTGQTFAGHPVSCAAGVAAVEAYEDGLVENVRALAPELEAGLRSLAEEFDVVADVHGRGFLWGVEFADPETGEHLFDPRVEEGDNPVDAVIAEARDRGVLVGSGRPTVQVVVAPPFCATADEIETAVDALAESVDAVF